MRTNIFGAGIIAVQHTADMLAEDTVVIASKAAKTSDSVHTAQPIDDLKARGLRMLLSYGKPRTEIRLVAHGVGRGTVHPRASACICGSNFLLSFCLSRHDCSWSGGVRR